MSKVVLWFQQLRMCLLNVTLPLIFNCSYRSIFLYIIQKWTAGKNTTEDKRRFFPEKLIVADQTNLPFNPGSNFATDTDYSRYVAWLYVGYTCNEKKPMGR